MSIQLSRRTLAAVSALCLAPFIVAAALDGDAIASDATRLNVTGVGYDTSPVSVMVVSAGVENFAVDASRAMARNSSAMAGLRRQLARYGVREEDFQTSNFSLAPGTHREDRESIKGYKVRHTLSIAFRDPAKAGEIIDALVDAGANNIQGPARSWEASPAAAARARAAAISDAMSRADVYAKALGMRVKRVVSINDSSGYASQGPIALPMVHAAATRIDPGQQNVTLTIGAQFELVRA